MTDWNAVQAFMAGVVAWPASATPGAGYVNLHYSMVDQKKPGNLVKGPGWPYQSINEFIKRAGWIASGHQTMKDVWFCTSRQSQMKLNAKGKPKAVRLAANATAQKSIWIDLDVGPSEPGKKPKYSTVEDALKAVLQFASTVGLPDPSAIVFSGSGVHVYWISKTEFTPAEWRPYASGLKNLLLANNVLCDAGLTTDIARILRVPGTFNHKTTPPKPVQLANLPLVMYDFEHKLGFLKQVAGPVTATPSAKEAYSPFAEGLTQAQRDTFKLPPMLAANPNDTLQAGIDKHEDALLKAEPILEQCGFMKHALETQGADYANPLWNLSVLCSAFMEDGNVIAHDISRGHPAYTHTETQQQFERKTAAKDRGVRGPSCETIQSNGCGACAACPYLGKISSPLKLATMMSNPSQGDGTTQQAPNAGKESADSEDQRGDGDETVGGAADNSDRLVVSKDDHMERARIYRSRKRPNLYHYRNDYYDHEAGHYTIIDDDTIRADLYNFLDTCDKEVMNKKKPTETVAVSFAPNKSTVSETAEALKALGHVAPTVEQPHWLNGRAGPNPSDLICFPNGILNINSNQFTPPDPMLFTPHGVGFDYDPNASAPAEWLNFLDQIFNGEVDQIQSLQEAFGYCLSDDVSQEKVFMVLGDKRSGKDTMRHTLQSLLSPTVICGPTLDSMGTNFGMSQFIGKQLAVVGDLRLGPKSDKDLLAEHVLKLSGRGLFTIDRKYKGHWTGILRCKLWLISNEMPKLNDASGALASRMIIFRTRTSFYGREDRHLFENKIKPELPAILLWALDGLRRMRQRGPIVEPACSIEAREELAREGSPIMSFVQECLTLDAAATVDKNILYSAYLDFAHHNGLRPNDKGWFYRNLDTATASKVKAERVQNGGVRVHNVVGARISNPPPRRPTKNEPIVIYATAPAATTQTAEDIGNPEESDVALDKAAARASKTASRVGRRSARPS